MEDNFCAKQIPATVKGGQIKEDGMEIKTANDFFNIKWDDVEFISIYKVMKECQSVNPAPRNNNRGFRVNREAIGMIRQVRDNAMRDIGSKSSAEESFVSYLKIRGLSRPFKFDTIGTNFRELLGPHAGYSGLINFNMALKKIISLAKNARLDPSAYLFETQGRGRIKIVSSNEEAWNSLRQFMKKCEMEDSEKRKEEAKVPEKTDLEKKAEIHGIIEADFDIDQPFLETKQAEEKPAVSSQITEKDDGDTIIKFDLDF
ncbi:MAG: hypothetical protein ACLFQV_05120 [Vulcanimicrobiota bacterium]